VGEIGIKSPHSLVACAHAPLPAFKSLSGLTKTGKNIMMLEYAILSTSHKLQVAYKFIGGFRYAVS
jgi:hypothetical protein